MRIIDIHRLLRPGGRQITRISEPGGRHPRVAEGVGPHRQNSVLSRRHVGRSGKPPPGVVWGVWQGSCWVILLRLRGVIKIGDTLDLVPSRILSGRTHDLFDGVEEGPGLLAIHRIDIFRACNRLLELNGFLSGRHFLDCGKPQGLSDAIHRFSRTSRGDLDIADVLRMKIHDLRIPDGAHFVCRKRNNRPILIISRNLDFETVVDTTVACKEINLDLIDRTHTP